MPRDVIVVRHPEFARLAHQISIATERFNHATKEKQGSLVFIGSQLTITLEDRKAFLDQLRTEQEAYDAIQELHEKIVHLLREESQAKPATTVGAKVSSVGTPPSATEHSAGSSATGNPTTLSVSRTLVEDLVQRTSLRSTGIRQHR